MAKSNAPCIPSANPVYLYHMEKGREDIIFERWKKINIPTKQIQHSAVNGGRDILQYDERNSGKKKKKEKRNDVEKLDLCSFVAESRENSLQAV
ncbi:hypothetical protein T12_12642 [Trichinella patagoniensis]|uniref:Uncharacterized protein n=1 Tax=Trichinella patagoniensis TaxID=990121 RepID=A0A0V0ZLT8_9BILA|nr:hypothetical protein T12_12642 [Trichinella patagoniensis]